MRRKQGQSHAKTHKQDYSERELKKKNGGARAGCACVKAGLEPGPLLHTPPFFPWPRAVHRQLQYRGNSKESKIERVKVKEDTEDRKVVCQ